MDYIVTGGKVSQESAVFESLQIQCLESFSVGQLLEPWNTLSERSLDSLD